MRWVVKAPPNNGATTEATLYIALYELTKSRRLLSGRYAARMMMKPALMPAYPIPAMARPVIKGPDTGATAQISDPTSNMKIDEMKTVLIG